MFRMKCRSVNDRVFPTRCGAMDVGGGADPVHPDGPFIAAEFVSGHIRIAVRIRECFRNHAAIDALRSRQIEQREDRRKDVDDSGRYRGGTAFAKRRS